MWPEVPQNDKEMEILKDAIYSNEAFYGFYVSLDSKKACEDVKIALGAVAPTPIRAAAAEGILRSKVLTEALAIEAGKAAGAECKPITDIRATESYRRSMVEVLTKRALLQALDRLNKGGVQ